MRTELQRGDRLISVKGPAFTRDGEGTWDYWHVGGGILSIFVIELPGPMGQYFAAQIQFEDRRPDIIIPIHMAEQIEIQYGD